MNSHIDNLFKKLDIFDFKDFSLMLNELDTEDLKILNYLKKLNLFKNEKYDLIRVQDALAMFNNILENTCEMIADNVDKHLSSYVSISTSL